MRDAFVGREESVAQLAGALDQAREGRPRVVLVEGPAGIGKTALLRAFRDEALTGETVVLRASGEETERSLAYGVLDQLADSGRDHLADMPSAFAERTPGGDPLTVGAVLLDVLGALQSDGPIVVVIDDVQWADTPSLQALVFAFRRLRVDRVLVLLAARADAVPMLPSGVLRIVASESGATLRLGGLDSDDLAALAAAMGSGSLSRRAAERLRDQTDGNPLLARALIEEVPADALHAADDTPLPAPRTFGAMALARLSACSAETQRFVAAASVLGRRFSVAAAVGMAQPSDAVAAMQEALDARLLAADASGRTSIFAHPLIRNAVYHGLGPADRAALHTRAAELTDDRGAALRHRAAAATQESEVIAAQLETLSDQEAAAGHWSAAAADLIRAAELSTTGDERELRTLRAVDYWILGGDVGEVVAYAERVDGFADTPWRRYIQGVLALMSGSMPEAVTLLRSAWEMADPADTAVTSRIAGQISIVGVAMGWGDESVLWARRAQDAPGAPVPITAQMFALALMGKFDDGLALTAGLPDPLARPGPDQIDPLNGRGVLRHWTDDNDRAIADLTAAAAASRNRGPLLLNIISLMYLAHAEFRRGDWSASIVHGGLGASAATDADLIFVGATTNAVASFPLTAQGDWEAAAAYVTAAGQAAAATGDLPSVLFAAAAAAQLALAQRDYEGAIAAVEPHQPNAGLFGGDEPSIVSWREPLAEALVRLGRLDEAEAALTPLEARGVERGLRSVQSGAARVRGLLEAARGNNDAAQTRFACAVEHADAVGMPYAAGLAELAHGEVLRRGGQRRAAATLLTSAQTRFRALAARPALERCDQELAACGLRQAPRDPHAGPRLTPQERAVAHLVAAGGSNRDVAAELVLSVKTVEYHLGHIFTALGINSRRQLATRLADLGDN
ncbi:MAG: hypothetical protein QOI61_724 [Actinomycetota bacterium]